MNRSGVNRSVRLYLLVGGLMVLFVLLVALLADRITTVSPFYMDARRSVLQGQPPFAPSALHPLGTDQYGRDVWSRVAYGTRWSLLFALLIAGGRLLLSLPLAAIGSFWPRSVGRLINRLYVYTSAIPPLLVYLFILNPRILRAAGLWPSVVITVFVLTLFEWPRLSMVLLNRLEALSKEEFVEGAIAVGASPARIFWVHLVPHLWPTLVQQVVAEVGRALLLIAQLGIFNIWVGGGMAVIEETMSGSEIVRYITGIPEWGSMLANSRAYIGTAPWMPLAPAFAFLISVTGFNVLAQGIEAVNIPWRRLRERTTGRLSKQWRWAVAVVPLLALVWFYGGTPWGRRAELVTLANQQTQALASGSIGQYLATLGPASPAYRTSEQRWAESLGQTGAPLTFLPDSIHMLGGHARGMWGVAVADGSEKPPQILRSIELVRRWNHWYQAGEGLTTIRGFFVDLEARYDPADPSPDEGRRRGNVHYLATAADHAWANAVALLPAAARNMRPQVIVYPGPDAFEAALVGLASPGASAALAAQAAPPEQQAPANASLVAMGINPPPLYASTPNPAAAADQASLPYDIWYQPGRLGEPIRISPRFVNDLGFDRARTERLLTQVMIEYAVAEQAPAFKGQTLLAGRFEDMDRGIHPYPLDVEVMANSPLLSLPDLLAARVGPMPIAARGVYTTQAAVLYEFLRGTLPDEAILAAAAAPDPLAALANAMGITPEALTTAYDTHMRGLVAQTSVLQMPAGRARIPLELTNAVSARAQAAVTGDDARFLSLSAPQARGAQAAWLHEARLAGLRHYDATVLDIGMQETPGTAKLFLLERLEFGDGKVREGVVEQTWVQENGVWVAAGASPLAPREG